jgi:hypothetical protein
LHFPKVSPCWCRHIGDNQTNRSTQRRWRVDRTDAHNDPFCAVLNAPVQTRTCAHIGGSARGYQGLPAPLAIPATAAQAAARSYFYASPTLA